MKSDGRASEEYAEVRVGSLYTSLATEPPEGTYLKLDHSAASLVSTAKRCSGEWWLPEDPTLLSIHKVSSMAAARLFEGALHRLLEGAESFVRSDSGSLSGGLSVSCTWGDGGDESNGGA